MVVSSGWCGRGGVWARRGAEERSVEVIGSGGEGVGAICERSPLLPLHIVKSEPGDVVHPIPPALKQLYWAHLRPAPTLLGPVAASPNSTGPTGGQPHHLESGGARFIKTSSGTSPAGRVKSG